MLGRPHKTPKVTPCLILIQENPKDFPAILLDAYLLQTAVKKYHIGVGQEHRKYTFKHPYSKAIEHIAVPLVQIDKFGLTNLKCPTTSGGKWFDGFDFSHCRGKDVFDIEGPNIKVLVRAGDTSVLNLFWMFLIFAEALKWRFDIFWPGYWKWYIDFTDDYIPILPLKKYPPFYLVSYSKWR